MGVSGRLRGKQPAADAPPKLTPEQCEQLAGAVTTAYSLPFAMLARQKADERYRLVPEEEQGIRTAFAVYLQLRGDWLMLHYFPEIMLGISVVSPILARADLPRASANGETTQSESA